MFAWNPGVGEARLLVGARARTTQLRRSRQEVARSACRPERVARRRGRRGGTRKSRARGRPPTGHLILRGHVCSQSVVFGNRGIWVRWKKLIETGAGFIRLLPVVRFVDRTRHLSRYNAWPIWMAVLSRGPGPRFGRLPEAERREDTSKGAGISARANLPFTLNPPLERLTAPTRCGMGVEFVAWAGLGACPQ